MLGLLQEEIDMSQKEWFCLHFTHRDVLIHVAESERLALMLYQSLMACPPKPLGVT